MKNVLVLTSTFPRWKDDTTPSFVYELCKEMSKKYHISVLAPHFDNAALEEKNERLKIYRFQYFFTKQQKLAYGAGILPNVKGSLLAKIQIPFFLASQFFKAVKIIEKDKINLIHSHWMIPQGVLGVYLKKKYNLPLIVTIHGSDLFPLKNKMFRKLQEFVVTNADIVTVNSATAKKELLSRFPKLKSDIRIIPMGINSKLSSRKPSRKNNNEKKILFVGRLNEQKGVEILIKAMPLVIKKFSNVSVDIIGDGEHRKNLERLSNGTKVEKYMHFLGPKSHSEVINHYKTSDAVVLPSVTSKIGTESFGLVLVEAMASGTCVIGSTSGGIKDIIKDGENGLLFQEKNHLDLAKKLIRVLKDEKLRRKLEYNGKKFVKKFDWLNISEEFNQAYEAVLR